MIPIDSHRTNLGSLHGTYRHCLASKLTIDDRDGFISMYAHARDHDVDNSTQISNAWKFLVARKLAYLELWFKLGQLIKVQDSHFTIDKHCGSIVHYFV